MYKNEYQAQQGNRRSRIFVFAYILLVAVAVTVGVAIRLQQIQNIRNRPSQARQDAFECVFCPARGADPNYDYIKDPTVVFCRTPTGQNVPIQDALVRYDYSGNLDGTGVEVDTDPNGLATYSFDQWSPAITNLTTGLTRTLNVNSIPNTITDSAGVRYNVNKSTVTNAPYNNPCANYFPVPFTGPASVSQTGSIVGPACSSAAGGTLTCRDTFTLQFTNQTNGSFFTWNRAQANACSGASAVTGYNPILPFDSSNNYWAPTPPALPQGDAGANTINDYVSYQGPLLKFQLSCTAVPACTGITGIPTTITQGQTLNLTAQTTAGSTFPGPYQWVVDLQEPANNSSRTFSYTVPDTSRHEIILRVGDEVDSNLPVPQACRVQFQASAATTTPTPTPTYVCGNGCLETGEVCDYTADGAGGITPAPNCSETGGNETDPNYQQCTNTCQLPTPTYVCNNGCFEPNLGEVCDPTADGTGGVTPAPYCDENGGSETDQNAEVCSESCTLPASDVVVTKGGPVCVEMNAPNNTATFTLTIRNDASAVRTITTITDTLPQGLTYISNTTTVNGTSSDEPATTTVGSSQQLVWNNGGDGWAVNAGSTLTVTYQVRVGAGATVGTKNNNVIVQVEGQPPSNDQATFTLAATCNPDTGILDNVFLVFLLAASSIAAGVYVLRNQEFMPAVKLTRSMNRVNSRLGGVAEDLRHRRSHKQYHEYRLQVYMKKKERKLGKKK